MTRRVKQYALRLDLEVIQISIFCNFVTEQKHSKQIAFTFLIAL